MNQTFRGVDLRSLYQAVNSWPTSESVTFPSDHDGSEILNRHLGQIARMATESAKRVFQALEENDNGVPWNTERRKRDAADLLFVALSQARLINLSEDELIERLNQIATKGGP